ncbi:MAG TPA: hypothetical protein PLT09_04325 [Deltaproteobacteria bacterium]|nr:hypothetical protein [Deltaproteobacteria bacterium]HPR54695.1 hypothetical protein [Deltaproteobacteria bacterium]HXK46641.1 hypothetical protein [Deltaproteobacteria bacterium]
MADMDALMERLDRLMDRAGVPLFGSGPSGALDREPEGLRPKDFLPDARGLFCFGMPLPEGIYRCPDRSVEMYWRALNMHFRTMDELSLHTAMMLEASGFTAAPVFACFPMEVRNKGELRGYVSLVRMAEACGLGKIGGNGLLFNARYGPRLILGGIVTEAALPQLSRPDADGRGCPEGCSVCREKCPAHAIGPQGKVDMAACIRHSTYAPIFSAVLGTGRVKTGEIGRLNLTTSVDEQNMNTCMACVSECPYLKGAAD